MEKQIKKICILGIGGSGRETLCCLSDKIADSGVKLNEVACFMVDDEYFKNDSVMGIGVIPRSAFQPEYYDVVVAIGDPGDRKKVVENLPANTTYTTIIHPTAIISPWAEIGEGSIITAGVILTCNIKIGKHTHLNLHTTIGHDCIIGDYFTTGFGVNISGNCSFGDEVYFGTNACIKEKLKICSQVTVGMGAVVVKNIDQKGTYIGNPAKKLEKKQ